MTTTPDKLFLELPDTRIAQSRNFVLHNALIAIAYIATGYLGLCLAFVGQSVTLFWPPSGIAFAALWIGGRRLIPGLAIGAFVVNVLTARNVDIAFLIMVGNTISTVSAGLLVRQRLLSHPHAGELQRVMSFILFAVLAGTVLSATIGTTTIMMLGHANATVESTWLVWWMGDAMGVLIVAPPVLLWGRIRAASADWRNLRDAMFFTVVGAVIIAGLAFLHNPLWAVELCKLFTLLLSLWAGARFGLIGPAAVTLSMAVGAVGVTAMGIGPFVRGNFYDSFATVHSYLFAEAIAGMLLAAALADLRRAVAREQEALGKVEAASANRIRLMSMISHDLRTPMAGLMGALQTMDRMRLPKEQARLIAFGLRAGESLSKLIGDILDIARVDTGQMVLHPTIFSPAQSLEDVASMHRTEAEAKDLAIKIRLDPSLPAFVFGDRVRFEQVVGNLVANAVAYTEHGHVSVTAGGKEQISVEVVDTGLGIPDELETSMFDAFVTTRPFKSRGLGLGLHICRQLVELMQGTIAYTRVEPHGSRFHVTLPLPTSAKPTAPPVEPAGQAGMRILLIDDDQIARETTAALLQALGHTVVSTESAEAAVAIAAKEDFELVLTDIHMGGSAMSGLEGVQAMRALTRTSPDCVILALTGNASEEERELYLRSGLDGVIVKPLNASQDLFAQAGARRDVLRTT